jgi:hypothetical protein
VSFLFTRLDILEAVRAFDCTIRTDCFVIGQILAEDRSFAVLAIRNLELAFLIGKERKLVDEERRKTSTKRQTCRCF